MTTADHAVTADAPIAAEERVRALDAVRGIALLGILVANVRQMFLPWDVANLPVSRGSERLAWLDWSVIHALVDLKFLTLFSLLFGIGFALQGDRVAARGGGFTATYLRRVLILALFGIAHGVLLYSAEVLLAYAIAGLMLLAVRGLSTDNLFRLGFVVVGAMLLWGYQFFNLGPVSLGITATAIVALAAAMILLWRRSWRLALTVWVVIVVATAAVLTLRFDPGIGAGWPAQQYWNAQNQLIAMNSNDATSWPKELLVRREGGFLALVRLHARQYADVLYFFAVFLLWRTLGLFLIGAALYRSGVFARASQVPWGKVAAMGLGVGLPLTLLATALHSRELVGEIDWSFPEFLHNFSALPLAVGIAGGVFALYRRGPRGWLCARIEAAGRMPLTNYLGQSLVMAALAESWGFGLYGRFDAAPLTLLGVIVFGVMAMLSHGWLTRYRMGPLEWLWRCGTYGRWLPNRQGRA